MQDKARKKRLAFTVLPVYVLLWVVVSGCSSGISSYLACIRTVLGSPSGAAVPANGLELPGFNGDIVFTGNLGEAIAANERRLVASTEWGIPFFTPESEVTVSGKFDPFGAGTRAAVRPKKIFMEINHVDANGKTLAKDNYKLKVKGDTIKPLTKTAAEVLVLPGERLDLYLKPKKAALDLSETSQVFFEMPLPMDARTVLAPQSLAGALGAASAFSEAAARGKELTVLTTTYGIGVEIGRKTVVISGGQQRFAPGLMARLENRLAPKKLKVTWEHLDSNGKVLEKFSFTMKFVNGTISPAVNKTFRGFSIAAGESTRLKVKPKGGKFTAGDLFGISFVVF